jgi:hypothetical protein
MNEFKFRDFKKLDYPDGMPVNRLLADMMDKGVIDTNCIMSCYTGAIERERHLNATKFEEACVNLTQMLGKAFNGKEKEEAVKRAIHTFNLTKTLVPHVHDSQYNYTEEDETKWDEFCKTIYGTNLKK